MKQRLFVFTVLFCLFSTAITAQTEKGKFSISGRSSIEGAYFSNRVYGDNISTTVREAMDVDGYSFSITPSLRVILLLITYQLVGRLHFRLQMVIIKVKLQSLSLCPPLHITFR